MGDGRPSSWMLVTCMVALAAHVVRADRCLDVPEETVSVCSSCAASPIRVDMDTCCSINKVMELCKNLPQLLGEGQQAFWLGDEAYPYRDSSYGPGGYSEEEETDEGDKRARPFLGKRPRQNMAEDEEKRARPFLGKKPHSSFVAKRAEDAALDAFLKRARPFLGKKARPFLGKRDDETDELMDMLKRARPFLGKKARPFLGKRDDDSEDLSDVLKRARPFLGKKARPFLG